MPVAGADGVGAQRGQHPGGRLHGAGPGPAGRVAGAELALPVRPQVSTTPVCSSTTPKFSAAITASAERSVLPASVPATGTGRSRVRASPTPSLPPALPPQATTVPSVRSARVWSAAALTEATSCRSEDPLMLSTGSGWVRVRVRPSPSWPTSLRPQASTVPSDRTATACRSPRATWATPSSRLSVPARTSRASGSSAAAPGPSWP